MKCDLLSFYIIDEKQHQVLTKKIFPVGSSMRTARGHVFRVIDVGRCRVTASKIHNFERDSDYERPRGFIVLATSPHTTIVR